MEAAGELKIRKLTVLTWDENKEIQENELTVRFVPLSEWLTKKIDG